MWNLWMFVDVFSSQGQLLADPSAFGYGRKSLVFERPGPKTSQHTPERRSVNDFSRQKLPQSNPVFDLLLSDP